MKDELTNPDKLEMANITMIHKKNSNLDFNNWRGIYVTSVLWKVLMKMIYERTYKKSSIQYDSLTNRGTEKEKCEEQYIF